MARRITGLDLGAYSVKLVRLECGKQAPKFEIISVSEEILPLDDGEEKELYEKQRDAVLKLYQQGLLEAEAYAIGLEALEGQMRTMKVPFVDNRKIEAILPGLLESELPFDVDGTTVSWHRIETENPAGSVNAEGASIRVAFGKKQAIARMLQLLQPSSIDPRFMHLGSAAPYELVRELGFQAFERASEEPQEDNAPLAAIIDFGHRATNICIFDRNGIKFTRSFLKGGKDLSETIASALSIPFKNAVALKHEKLDLVEQSHDEEAQRISELGRDHFNDLFGEILRTFIVAKTSGVGHVESVLLIGGVSSTTHFQAFFEKKFGEQGIHLVPPANFLPAAAPSPSTALALAYSLSGLQIHAKDSRFNFRKDEFAWRGELDFIRTKSGPLALWGLILICSLTILWSASSLVLDKENQYLDSRLKAACAQILGQKNVAPKKCLTMMKEQISSHTDLGIPEFTASDVYLKTAEFLPKELNITITELDVMEKKVRINADTGNFEDIDKVVSSLSNIPCFFKVEKGRAQQVGNVVKFSLSADFECNPTQAQQKQKS